MKYSILSFWSIYHFYKKADCSGYTASSKVWEGLPKVIWMEWKRKKWWLMSRYYEIFLGYAFCLSLYIYIHTYLSQPWRIEFLEFTASGDIEKQNSGLNLNHRHIIPACLQRPMKLWQISFNTVSPMTGNQADTFHINVKYIPAELNPFRIKHDFYI